MAVICDEDLRAIIHIYQREFYVPASHNRTILSERASVAGTIAFEIPSMDIFVLLIRLISFRSQQTYRFKLLLHRKLFLCPFGLIFGMLNILLRSKEIPKIAVDLSDRCCFVVKSGGSLWR